MTWLQANLIRWIGLAGNQETLGQEAIDAYIRLFNRLMSQVHIAAMAVLFGWTTPEDGEAPLSQRASTGRRATMRMSKEQVLVDLVADQVEPGMRRE